MNRRWSRFQLLFLHMSNILLKSHFTIYGILHAVDPKHNCNTKTIPITQKSIILISVLLWSQINYLGLHVKHKTEPMEDLSVATKHLDTKPRPLKLLIHVKKSDRCRPSSQNFFWSFGLKIIHLGLHVKHKTEPIEGFCVAIKRLNTNLRPLRVLIHIKYFNLCCPSSQDSFCSLGLETIYLGLHVKHKTEPIAATKRLDTNLRPLKVLNQTSSILVSTLMALRIHFGFLVLKLIMLASERNFSKVFVCNVFVQDQGP